MTSAERKKQWRRENPEKAKEYNRRWRLKHPEKAKEIRKRAVQRQAFERALERAKEFFLKVKSNESA